MENIKKHLPKLIIFIVLSLGLYYAYGKYKYSTSHEDTDNAQIETYFVPILSRMSGFVKAINVKDYDTIEKNEVLVEIDNEEGQLSLAELKADLAQAETDVENANANIQNLTATLKSMDANLKAGYLRKEKARKDNIRDNNLLADNAITTKQADDSKSNYEILSAQNEAGNGDLVAAKSKMGILQANLHKAQAAVALKKVKIEQQQLKLTYSKLYAPISGKIGKANIEIGQYIQAGQPLMTIVKDSTFWVIANFKETQVSKLLIGSEAELKLDAFPDKILKGKIVSISESTGAKTSLLPPDNASGNFVKVTQRVPVKIEILNANELKGMLRAGLSLEVSVKLGAE